MARGCRRAGISAISLPLADGGDGTLAALKAAGLTEGELETVNALGEPVRVPVGYLERGRTAVLETAHLLGSRAFENDQGSPQHRHTQGVGLALHRLALRPQIKEVWIGLGGSLTADGGMGFLDQVGYQFLDQLGNPIRDPARMRQIATVSYQRPGWHRSDLNVRVLVDVDNPLGGPEGARMFMAQKGFDPLATEAREMDLKHLANVLEAFWGQSYHRLAGAGSAGGLGFALYGCQAQVVPGAEFIMDRLNLNEIISQVDLVLTGEGHLDEQTARGKILWGLAERCRRLGKKITALCGSVDPNFEFPGHMIALAIQPGPCTVNESLEQVRSWLTFHAHQIAKFIT